MNTETPYQTTLEKLEELNDLVGKEIGLTEWQTISQERINRFAETTEDTQWIHMDLEKSKAYSPYKTTVAHGFLVLSLASKFSYETLNMKDVVMGVNYGLDKVRFPNATREGASLRGRVSVLSYDKIPGGAKYKLNIVFEIKGEAKPACVAEFIAMAYTLPV